MGDSKTWAETWQPTLVASLISATGNQWAAINRGVNSQTVALEASIISAVLAQMPAESGPTYALVNLGANDVRLTLPTEATWETNLGTILDAIHAKYPTALVYVAKPWVRGYSTNCNTIAGWIDTTLSTRGTWAFVGIDERGSGGIEGVDNGNTYTLDGVHYSAAGDALVAGLWKTVLGY